MAAAAARWPVQGWPANPRGWLVTVASRRLAGLPALLLLTDARRPARMTPDGSLVRPLTRASV